MSYTYFDLDNNSKINIYVSEETYERLITDMDLFGVCVSKSGQPNKNDFINRLIINYSESFRNNYEAKYESIMNKLKESIIDKVDYEILSTSLLENINKIEMKNDQSNNVTIPYRPQTKNEALMDELKNIDSFLKKHKGEIPVSTYFRNMLNEYCSLPQNKREEIVFLKTYNIIQDAIRNKKHITFIFDGFINGQKTKYDIGCCPFAMVSDKDRKSNYLLAYSDEADSDGNLIPEKNRILSRKLSKILSVQRDLHKPYFISDDAIEELRNRKKNPDRIDNNVYNTYVLFNAHGYNKYRNMTNRRPIGSIVKDETSIDKDVLKVIKQARKKLGEEYCYLYRFDSTKFNIVNYFVRVGKDAVIVYPEEIAKAIIDHHLSTCDIYKSLKN